MNDASDAMQPFDSALILQSLPDAVIVIDQQGCVVVWNSMAEQISGYAANELLGRECPGGLLQEISQCADSCFPDCSAQSCFNDGQRREMVTYIRHRDGHPVPVLVKLSPVMQNETVLATVAQFSDMTPHAMQEPHAATAPEPGEWVDSVTLLPSMLASTAQLRESFERWKLTGERFSAVLISAADMHAVEQQHGKEMVERLFSALGKTLSGALRHDDFIGCWMEEDFIALLPHCAQQQACEAGRRLVAVLQQTAVCHDGAYVSTRVHFAATSVRANDIPARLLERLYQELKRKEQLDPPTSARRPIPFHQQRPM
jgi:PAS domain S-box-containing protein